MGYILNLCSALEDDIDALYEANQEQAALWDELIDELFGSARLREELTMHNGYNHVQPHFDTVPVGVYLKLGFNVSRLKLYRPGGRGPFPHRLLYTVHHTLPNGAIWLLGLMPRHGNYEPQDLLGTRIRHDYDSLGIPRIPRG